MKDETINTIAHTVVDIAGIAALAILCCMGKISENLAFGGIAVIVGIWAKMSGGSLKTPPTGGLILGFIEPLINMYFRKN
jgi:hypothetical protein